MKRVILVGSNPRTRSAIPWDADAPIWTLNEAPQSAWVKRWDVLFQIHPRWDWERDNNPVQPNHPLFIKAQSAPCLFCKGQGRFTLNDNLAKCPHCAEGQYVLPDHRAGKKIVMQDDNVDVPGCIRLPVEALTRRYCADGVPYFTSTFAHMLVSAFSLGYDDITLYGWGMESDTEYAYQRACAEYWIGYGRALGIKIEAPGSRILKGEHYGYSTWMQGYRTRLEVRANSLRQQINDAHAEAIKSEGALDALNAFKVLPEVTPAWEQRFDEHFRRKQMVSFLQGTLKEIENAMAIYDAYHGHEDGQEPEGVKDLLGLTYTMD